MLGVLLGLVVGVAFGLIVMAFLAIGSYERGYRAAISATWRRELTARHSRPLHLVSKSAA
jgi:hypothetical protein